MKKKIKQEVSIEIDKLTNSIENVITGEVFDTGLSRITEANKREIKKKDWLFNWHEEIKQPDKEIYKLTIKNEPNVIQGLMSLKLDDKFIFVNLVESAKHNRGKDKKYRGVPGNLFAFACKYSMDLGFDGYVMFIAKTSLIEHYKKTLNAQVLFGQRMVLKGESANNLISKYFNS